MLQIEHTTVYNKCSHRVQELLAVELLSASALFVSLFVEALAAL
jgi:hypothetical protein